MKSKIKPVIATVFLLSLAFFITEAVIIQNGILSAKKQFVYNVEKNFDRDKIISELNGIENEESFINNLSEELSDMPYIKTIIMLNADGMTAMTSFISSKKQNKLTEQQKQLLFDTAKQAYFDADFSTPHWIKSSEKNESVRYDFLFSFNEMPTVLLIEFKLEPLKAALQEDNTFFFLIETATGFLILQLTAILFYVDYFKKKEKLEEEHNCFINGIAHELKTPLSEAISLTDCCFISDNEEKRQQYLSKITNCLDGMGKTIEMFLKNSSLTTEKPKRENFSLTIAAKEKINEFSPLFLKKELNLQFNASEPLYICGDKQLISIVIENFLSNALKYTIPHGNVKVKVYRKGHNAIFSIFNETDTSLNIKTIWDSAYKLGNGTGRVNGVGLSLCKKILCSNKYHYGCKKESGGVIFFFETKTKKTKGEH